MLIPTERFRKKRASIRAHVLPRLQHLVGIFLVVAATAAHAAAQTTVGASVLPQGTPNGKIRGVVFDSLIMAPLRGATVTLLGRTESDTTDARGQFSFDNVPAGAQTLMFSAAALDSLGLGTMGDSFNVALDETRRVTLATPSLRTLWQRICVTTPPSKADSGIVWGTIGHANSSAPLNKAVAAFSWYDLVPKRTTGLVVNDSHKEVLTDSTGLYFACGLPSGVVITSAAIDASPAREKGASGYVEFALGDRQLKRLDLLVSADMVFPETANGRAANDSAALARPRGRATLKGIVVDEQNRPVKDATITALSADTSVRTTSEGTFVLGGLPGGTQSVQIKRIGFAPINELVALRSDSISQITVRASAVNVISTFHVRTASEKSANRREYEARRKQGFGYYLEGKQLENRVDLRAALSLIPGLTVSYTGSDLVVTAKGTFTATCKPNIFLDGIPSDLSVIKMRQPDDFRAIEAFVRGSTAPAQYSSFAGCGALLFWTRNASW